MNPELQWACLNENHLLPRAFETKNRWYYHLENGVLFSFPESRGVELKNQILMNEFLFEIQMKYRMNTEASPFPIVLKNSCRATIFAGFHFVKMMLKK